MNEGIQNERVFALRGATSVGRNDEASILAATRELITEIMEQNRLVPEKMVSCIFTSTEDLNAEFPAVEARELGLNAVPLLCTRELNVPGSLELCIRVMIHFYADAEHETKHVYLKEAQSLRSDLQSAQ